MDATSGSGRRIEGQSAVPRLHLGLGLAIFKIKRKGKRRKKIVGRAKRARKGKREKQRGRKNRITQQFRRYYRTH